MLSGGLLLICLTVILLYGIRPISASCLSIQGRTGIGESNGNTSQQLCNRVEHALSHLVFDDLAMTSNPCFTQDHIGLRWAELSIEVACIECLKQ
jgi:hypothetical protein